MGPSSKIRLGMVVGLGATVGIACVKLVMAATAASFTTRFIKSTHSSGVERPRTPPWSIRPSNSTGRIDQEGGVDRSVNGAHLPGVNRPWGGSTVNERLNLILIYQDVRVSIRR